MMFIGIIIFATAIGYLHGQVYGWLAMGTLILIVGLIEAAINYRIRMKEEEASASWEKHSSE